MLEKGLKRKREGKEDENSPKGNTNGKFSSRNEKENGERAESQSRAKKPLPKPRPRIKIAFRAANLPQECPLHPSNTITIDPSLLGESSVQDVQLDESAMDVDALEVEQDAHFPRFAIPL